jgi:hypothetical protein
VLALFFSRIILAHEIEQPLHGIRGLLGELPEERESIPRPPFRRADLDPAGGDQKAEKRDTGGGQKKEDRDIHHRRLRDIDE